MLVLDGSCYSSPRPTVLRGFDIEADAGATETNGGPERGRRAGRLPCSHPTHVEHVSCSHRAQEGCPFADHMASSEYVGSVTRRGHLEESGIARVGG